MQGNSEGLMIDGFGKKRCIGKEMRGEVNINSVLMNGFSTNPNETAHFSWTILTHVVQLIKMCRWNWDVGF